jgi:hypothetical protein
VVITIRIISFASTSRPLRLVNNSLLINNLSAKRLAVDLKPLTCSMDSDLFLLSTQELDLYCLEVFDCSWLVFTGVGVAFSRFVFSK